MSPPPYYSDDHNNSPPSGPSVAVVICAVIGSVLFVLAFSAIVVIEFTRRKRRRQDAREQLSPVGMFPKRVNASSQSIYYPQDSPGHGRIPLLDHDHHDHDHLRPPPDYKMRYNPHLTSPTHSPRESTYRPSPEDMSARDALEYPPLPQEPTRVNANPCPSSYHEHRPRRQKESDPIPPPRLSQLSPRSIRFQQPSDGIGSLSFPEPPVTTTQDSVVAPHRHHVWHPPISKPKKIRLPRLAIPDPPLPLPTERHIPVAPIISQPRSTMRLSVNSSSSVSVYSQPSDNYHGRKTSANPSPQHSPRNTAPPQLADSRSIGQTHPTDTFQPSTHVENTCQDSPSVDEPKHEFRSTVGPTQLK